MVQPQPVRLVNSDVGSFQETKHQTSTTSLQDKILHRLTSGSLYSISHHRGICCCCRVKLKKNQVYGPQAAGTSARLQPSASFSDADELVARVDLNLLFLEFRNNAVELAYQLAQRKRYSPATMSFMTHALLLLLGVIGSIIAYSDASGSTAIASTEELVIGLALGVFPVAILLSIEGYATHKHKMYHNGFSCLRRRKDSPGFLTALITIISIAKLYFHFFLHPSIQLSVLAGTPVAFLMGTKVPVVQFSYSLAILCAALPCFIAGAVTLGPSTDLEVITIFGACVIAFTTVEIYWSEYRKRVRFQHEYTLERETQRILQHTISPSTVGALGGRTQGALQRKSLELMAAIISDEKLKAFDVLMEMLEAMLSNHAFAPQKLFPQERDDLTVVRMESVGEGSVSRQRFSSIGQEGTRPLDIDTMTWLEDMITPGATFQAAESEEARARAPNIFLSNTALDAGMGDLKRNGTFNNIVRYIKNPSSRHLNREASRRFKRSTMGPRFRGAEHKTGEPGERLPGQVDSTSDKLMPKSNTENNAIALKMRRLPSEPQQDPDLVEIYPTETFQDDLGDDLPSATAPTKLQGTEDNWGFGSMHQTDMSMAEISDIETKLFTVLDSIHSPQFDVDELFPLTGNQPLLVVTMHLLHRYDLINALDIGTVMLEKYFMKVESRYNQVPYHNGAHAADVVASSHRFLTMIHDSLHITPLQLFSIFFSAAVHDFEHPGYDNRYLVQMCDDKAYTHNDFSVLENHHISAAFMLMKTENLNFLQHLHLEDFKEFRRIAIEMVLATDLSRHMEIINKFEMILSSSALSSHLKGAFVTAHKRGFSIQHQESRKPIVLSSPENKQLLWNVVLKCADLGHAVKPWVLHTKWSYRIIEENFRQGDDMSAKGLPINKHLDRSGLADIPSGQSNFLEFMCYPLMRVFAEYSHRDDAVLQLKSNQAKWNDMANEGYMISSHELMEQQLDPFLHPLAWEEGLESMSEEPRGLSAKSAGSNASGPLRSDRAYASSMPRHSVKEDDDLELSYEPSRTMPIGINAAIPTSPPSPIPGANKKGLDVVMSSSVPGGHPRKDGMAKAVLAQRAALRVVHGPSPETLASPSHARDTHLDGGNDRPFASFPQGELRASQELIDVEVFKASVKPWSGDPKD